MAQEQNISTQLNNLLVTRNFHPETLDRQGKPSDASEAKTFTFDYVSGSGKNYGTMVIVMDSDDDMKVFYGDNLGRAMEGDDKDEFFDFQQQLSKFANAHRWTYTGTDLSQLKHTMQGLAAIQEGLFEGYYGTRKISYAGEPTEARLMIKHNRTLGEADARFRYVESLFIETADGERFKLPFKNLSGGRAMLEHVRQGGNPYDVRGVHIAEMIQEIGTLSRFNRASATRVMEGATQELIAEARDYYKSLRENMKRLASPRGYSAYFETWHPATIDEQQELVENIKTLFIEQTLDTRIEAALPLLARIQQQGTAMKEAEIFENWANNLVEGTWSVPETPEQENKLRELLSSELIVGPDATNATEQLYDLIGDDELFDRLGEIASKDPNADVRDVVINRLQELGYDLGIDTNPSPEQDVAEASWLQGRLQSPEELVWKLTSMSYDEAVAKYGAKNVRHGPKLRNGDSSVEVHVPLGGHQDVAEGAEDMTPNWAKYVVKQIYNSNGGVTMTDLFDEGIPGLRNMFMDVAQELSLDPDEDFTEVEAEVLERLEHIIKGGHGLDESAELNAMLKHAGVPVAEGRILDESGETLDHILNRFKHEVDQFEAGADLDNDLYYALFDYYSDAGEIPYGIAKGRDGDPVEWITQRLDQELGTGNYAKRLPEDETVDTTALSDRLAGAGALGVGLGIIEGSCNMTAEGEYCPEHGLMECGGMYEMSTVAGGMAPVVGEGHDDPINYNGAITGSYYESKESNTLLARIKSLALTK